MTRFAAPATQPWWGCCAGARAATAGTSCRARRTPTDTTPTDRPPGNALGGGYVTVSERMRLYGLDKAGDAVTRVPPRTTKHQTQSTTEKREETHMAELDRT